MKIMLNKCYGGFGFSYDFWLRYYKEVKNIELYIYKREYDYGDIMIYKKVSEIEKRSSFFSSIILSSVDLGDRVNQDSLYNSEFIISPSARELREDKNAIRIFEENPELYNGWAANIVVVDIPDGMKYTISDYDGIETLRPANIQEW